MTLEEAIKELEHRENLLQVALSTETNINRKWYMQHDLHVLQEKSTMLLRAQIIIENLGGS